MAKTGKGLYYGWVIVAIFFVMSTIMYGIQSSFGVFFNSISSEFQLARAGTSAIFSVQNIFGAALAFTGGWSVDRYGPRITVLLIGIFACLSLLLTSRINTLWQLFLTYSLLFSVIGAAYTTIMSTVSRWFDKNRGLALGIAGIGIGLGPVTIAPLASYLIASFDWRTAYLILGAIAGVLIIPGALFLRSCPPSEKSGEKPPGSLPPPAGAGSGAGELTLKQAGRTRSFWFFSVTILLVSFCYMLVMIHLVPHATDIGIAPMQAVTILSVSGASFIAGRLIIGKISDFAGKKKTAVLSAVMMALAMLWLIWARDLPRLYVFAVVFGLFQGGLDTLIAALIGYTFGVRNIGIIMGATQVFFGLGTVIGPAFAGIVYDLNRSYSGAFLAAAIGMFIVCLLIGLTRREGAGEAPVKQNR